MVVFYVDKESWRATTKKENKKENESTTRWSAPNTAKAVVVKTKVRIMHCSTHSSTTKYYSMDEGNKNDNEYDLHVQSMIEGKQRLLPSTPSFV